MHALRTLLQFMRREQAFSFSIARKVMGIGLLTSRAFKFAIRIDSIRFVMRIDSNRFVLLKKSAFRFTSCHAAFLADLVYSLSQNKLSLFAAFIEHRQKNNCAMHTIKITPNLLFRYQCTSGKFIRLPNIESNRKNRFGSENRIESNRNFFPELECSTGRRCAVAIAPCIARRHNSALHGRPPLLPRNALFPRIVRITGASPSEMGWLAIVRYLDIYLFYVYRPDISLN